MCVTLKLSSITHEAGRSYDSRRIIDMSQAELLSSLWHPDTNRSQVLIVCVFIRRLDPPWISLNAGTQTHRGPRFRSSLNRKLLHHYHNLPCRTAGSFCCVFFRHTKVRLTVLLSVVHNRLSFVGAFYMQCKLFTPVLQACEQKVTIR